METLDIIFLCCLIPAIIVGLWKGAVSQIISFLVIYLGITLSLRFADPVSAWIISHFTISHLWVKIISLVVIFIAVAILLVLMGKLLEKIVKVSMLNWANRLCGMLVSVAVTILILSFLVYITEVLNTSFQFIPKGLTESSEIYQKLLDLARAVFPHLRSLF